MTKEKIIFIDSDGTVMDSMLIKHKQALAPALIEAFKLEDIKEVIVKRWYDENLYQITRGLNRFDALLSVLKYLETIGRGVPYLTDYEAWLQNTTSKSLQSLEEYIKNNHVKPMPEVINWGKLVTIKMEDTKEIIKPFKEVGKALAKMAQRFKIIIVSTANKKSLENEWSKYGFLQYVTEICSQEVGTKDECIKNCLVKYEPSEAIMIGDSVVDYNAAFSNHICFYPMLPNKEDERWTLWIEKYDDIFANGNYKTVNAEQVELFFNSLNKKQGC